MEFTFISRLTQRECGDCGIQSPTATDSAHANRLSEYHLRVSSRETEDLVSQSIEKRYKSSPDWLIKPFHTNLPVVLNTKVLYMAVYTLAGQNTNYHVYHF